MDMILYMTWIHYMSSFMAMVLHFIYFTDPYSIKLVIMFIALSKHWYAHLRDDLYMIG